MSFETRALRIQDRLESIPGVFSANVTFEVGEFVTIECRLRERVLKSLRCLLDNCGFGPLEVLATDGGTLVVKATVVGGN